MVDRIKNLPILIFLLVGFAIAGFKYLNLLTDSKAKQDQISQLKSTLQEKKSNLTKAKNATDEIPNIKNEIDNLSQALSHATELIPKNLTYREILDSIAKSAQTAGVHIIETKPLELQSNNYFDSMPLNVVLEGSYSQLTNYLYLLSKEKIILHAIDLEISTKEILDGQVNLKLGGTITAFKYKETK